MQAGAVDGRTMPQTQRLVISISQLMGVTSPIEAMMSGGAVGAFSMVFA
jgi:hypothetical protein